MAVASPALLPLPTCGATARRDGDDRRLAGLRRSGGATAGRHNPRVEDREAAQEAWTRRPELREVPRKRSNREGVDGRRPGGDSRRPQPVPKAILDGAAGAGGVDQARRPVLTRSWRTTRED
jgi:hypothetical protein